ncbi:MAG: LytTR family DNA-binding domain-containing protein [Coprobacillus sp.]
MYKLMIIENANIIENHLRDKLISFVKNMGKGDKSAMLLKGNLKIDNQEYLLNLACDCEVVILKADPGEEKAVLSFAKYLRKRTGYTDIVFVANDVKYATSGYDVDATAYLTSDNYEENIENTLKKVVSSLSKKNMTCVVVEYDGEIVRIPCRDIRYLESSKNIVNIYTEYGLFKDRRKLNEYDNVLNELPNYLRIHQSFAVNLTYCYKFERSGITMFDGTFLPISRSRYNAAHKVISEFAKHIILYEDIFET